MNLSMRVFVSHSSRNLEVAIRVEEALHARGHDPWLDATDIRAGELLRTELHDAIAGCDAVVVLWSEPASRSRWCATEILAAHHLARGIVVGDVDGTPRAPLLSEPPIVSIASDGPVAVVACVETVSPSTYEPPSVPRELDPHVRQLHDEIGGAQLAVLTAADADLRQARRHHAELTEQIVGLAERFSGEPVFWTLLGYQLKNTYQLAWWDQQGALRPPADPILLEAEQWFFRSLFTDPDDLEALNGLGSVLITEREAEAATFFIDRVLAIAAAQRVTYPAAVYDRQLADSLRRDRIGLQRRLEPHDGNRRRPHRGVLLASEGDLTSQALHPVVERLGVEPATALDTVPAACSRARTAVTVWSETALDDGDQLTRLLVAVYAGCRIVLLRLDATPPPDLLAGVLSVDLQTQRPEELDKLARTLHGSRRGRQVLLAARDWEPPALRRVGVRVVRPATSDRTATRRLVRDAQAAADDWPGYPGAQRYLGLAHCAAARSMTSARGASTRRRHLEQARLAALRALLLDPTDAPSLSLLGELSTQLELPLADYFTAAAHHYAEQRGEEVR
jgi:hypothetical protein